VNDISNNFGKTMEPMEKLLDAINKSPDGQLKCTEALLLKKEGYRKGLKSFWKQNTCKNLIASDGVHLTKVDGTKVGAKKRKRKSSGQNKRKAM
jgi:hypothetical protein